MDPVVIATVATNRLAVERLVVFESIEQTWLVSGKFLIDYLG